MKLFYFVVAVVDPFTPKIYILKCCIFPHFFSEQD